MQREVCGRRWEQSLCNRFVRDVLYGSGKRVERNYYNEQAWSTRIDTSLLRKYAMVVEKKRMPAKDVLRKRVSVSAVLYAK